MTWIKDSFDKSYMTDIPFSNCLSSRLVHLKQTNIKMLKSYFTVMYVVFCPLQVSSHFCSKVVALPFKGL